MHSIIPVFSPRSSFCDFETEPLTVRFHLIKGEKKITCQAEFFLNFFLRRYVLGDKGVRREGELDEF